ncbi:MAG: hypothetical protein B7Y86_00415 [Brevundimonas subvibrioides]|uniref:Uncharacterized protein n=1 Tax=Brevundimonas subvibrioides TaxID=74313 RepID=A0A258HRH8_9CAUL|nr:hypothetical protein [Brevundimonas subvibrioides]OYX58933.1 MAG: hypothetical protein B7Y86_00415 [Brevundimonas subvibrioides]
MVSYLALLMALGAAIAIWPSQWAMPSTNARLRRLREIEGGAPEKFFEERRTLAEYQPTPRFLLLWRMVGAAIGITAAVLLIMEVMDQRNEDTARIEATHAMAAARIAVGKAESGDRATYREAQAEVARADAALKRWEELAKD